MKKTYEKLRQNIVKYNVNSRKERSKKMSPEIEAATNYWSENFDYEDGRCIAGVEESFLAGVKWAWNNPKNKK